MNNYIYIYGHPPRIDVQPILPVLSYLKPFVPLGYQTDIPPPLTNARPGRRRQPLQRWHGKHGSALLSCVVCWTLDASQNSSGFEER